MRNLILAAALAAAPAAQAVELGPLAPAAEGKAMCFSPNTAAKTCLSIDTYRVAANGQIEHQSVEMISPTPLVVMTARDVVEVKGDSTCSIGRASDLANATFTVEGRPLDTAQTARARANLAALMKPLLGHKGCAVYRPQGDGLLAAVAIDGTPAPQYDHRVLWISPADGWRVGF
jgi:hypothetical protein